MKNQEKKLDSVFWVSASSILILVLCGVFFPAAFADTASSAFSFTTYAFGWFYLLAVLILSLFCLFLAFSKYGRIRLGRDDERPEFSFFTWIGMLFSAGLGAGLVFWGIAEPMNHFFETPLPGVEPLTTEAARLSMGYSFFHWGISQWSVFTMVGLITAYYQFRRQENNLISTSLSPILNKRKNPAPIKKAIDILAVVATVMGIATSLGLGIMQINGGLNIVFGIGNSAGVQLIIIGLMLILYLLSSSTGLEKGIKWLSNLNLTMALLLMAFVFMFGPTVFILNTFTLGLGDYINHFIEYSLRLTPYRGGTWVRDWTIFYWAWAIAWSPFVGAFIARVSRGRTIREFVFGVLLIPPFISLLWIAVFGGTALHFDLFEGKNIAEAVNKDITSALFLTLNELPLSTIFSIMAVLLIFTFLITSADSATYILASMTTNGSLIPPLAVRIVWGVLMAAISAVLLLASGLEGLQTASLLAALPFTVILLLMCFTLFKLLRTEASTRKDRRKQVQ